MEDTQQNMFREAVESLRQGRRSHAKDLLTHLIKADQKNPTYWIWMSAAVDTRKERIYCLETALKVDPDNALAKRGLQMMGARPLDKNVKPFSMPRNRAWEDKIFLANEEPHEKGLAAVRKPLVRVLGLAGVGVVLLMIIGLGAIYGRRPQAPQSTQRPAGTFTATPTFINIASTLAATPGKPTPLAILLGVSYTATPAYINTPRAPDSLDIFRAAKAAATQGNFDDYVGYLEQIRTLEPESADVPYAIAEGYMSRRQCKEALFYYNESVKVDQRFAPGYLGLARARLCMEPGADTTDLYDLAIGADPAYGQIFLDRANFYMDRKDWKHALPDLAQAETLMPDSALVQVGYAEAYLQQGSNTKALEAAQKANRIDVTLLPSYYYLAKALLANGQDADAIRPLQTYLVYEPTDGAAYAELGRALAETGAYRAAVDALNLGLKYDPNQVQSFIYLGTSYLKLNNPAGAEVSFRRAIQFYPNSFDANIGLTEIYYRKETFGSAYLQAETSMSKATTDTEKAQALYWRALSQEGRKSYAEAVEDWKSLLQMPPAAMTTEMRNTAQEHLQTIVVPTSTLRITGPTRTPTPTSTNRPGNTATPAPAVLTPSVTPTKKP